MPGCALACPPADVASCAFTGSLFSVFQTGFCLFLGCLLVVMVFAQTLVVGWIHKQCPVAPKGLDVIHHRGPGTNTSLGTFPAKGLPQELGRTQVLCPDRQTVPGMPLGRDPSACLGGLMLGAVSITGQGRTSRMPAGPERLLCHWAITSGQNKKRPSLRPPQRAVKWLRRWSLWTLAQALRYSRCFLARTVCTVAANCERLCSD